MRMHTVREVRAGNRQQGLFRMQEALFGVHLHAAQEVTGDQQLA